MSRVVLIHWNEQEAQPRLESLLRLGFEAAWTAPQGSPGLRVFRNDPPDAFVIDLSRLPSAGQAVALELRRQAATRCVPIVFAGGEPEKVARLQHLLPDAVYTDWENMAAALPKANREAPSIPLVPDTMAGYAGVPLVRKLGIKAGTTAALVGPPEGFETKLRPLPDGAVVSSRARDADRVLLFARYSKELERRFAAAAARVKEGGGLWVVWPKRASGTGTDLTQAAVRKFGLGAGWVDYKICAVDETWSGLLFARRATPGSGRGKPTAREQDSR